MIIKNLKKYFSFEVQVLDDKNVRRRFRASNYQVRLSLETVHVNRSICWLFLFCAVNDTCEAVHMHDANAPWWGMEPDPVQSVRLHSSCIWKKLHRSAPRPNPCELPYQAHILLRSALHWGRTPPRVQTVPSNSKELTDKEVRIGGSDYWCNF